MDKSQEIFQSSLKKLFFAYRWCSSLKVDQWQVKPAIHARTCPSGKHPPEAVNLLQKCGRRIDMIYFLRKKMRVTLERKDSGVTLSEENANYFTLRLVQTISSILSIDFFALWAISLETSTL